LPDRVNVNHKMPANIKDLLAPLWRYEARLPTIVQSGRHRFHGLVKRSKTRRGVSMRKFCVQWMQVGSVRQPASIG
jgi:hypothetical protein